MPDLLLSVRNAARYLDLTPKAVYRLIDAGDLEVIRITPRCTRITTASITRFLETRTSRLYSAAPRQGRS